MHNQFTFWLEMGFKHIITWQALDHILYVVALCASLSIKEWKKILVSVTAFTIGHSITLLLVSLNIIDFNVKWVEFFIPITIAATCLFNILQVVKKIEPSKLIYIIAVAFGLIHGMAYGVNDISSMYDKKNEILQLTLAFNLGVELGQIIVVCSYLAIVFLVLKLIKIDFKWVKLILSSLILVYSLFLAIKNLP